MERTTMLDYALPSSLAHLRSAIDASRSMLELEDDWDGEGSPGYDETTWRRAVDFLVRNSIRLWDEHGLIVEAPKIRKGPQGSIDIHWRTPTRELLVNVPAAADELADYYGDDGLGGHQVRGTLDIAGEDDRLLLWLAK